MEPFQSWLSHGNIPSPWRESDRNHMKSWITTDFQQRETSLRFVLKIGDVVERSKSNQHLVEDVFVDEISWSWRVPEREDLRDSNLFQKKHLRDSTVFFTTNLWLWNPPQNILQLCVGNFLDNVNIAAGVFWSKFGTFEKAGFLGFPDEDIIHSWLWEKTRREQWNSKSTTCFDFLTAHRFEKGENPKKEKVPLANDHFSGLVAFNLCGEYHFSFCFGPGMFYEKMVVAGRWSSNTDNQQQIFSSERRSGPP